MVSVRTVYSVVLQPCIRGRYVYCLQNSEKLIRDAMQSMLSSKKQGACVCLCVLFTFVSMEPPTGQDQLLFVVYEKIPVDEESIEPHLWIYCSKISLEHLSNQQGTQKKFPILQEFIKEVQSLYLMYTYLLHYMIVI